MSLTTQPKDSNRGLITEYTIFLCLTFKAKEERQAGERQEE